MPSPFVGKVAAKAGVSMKTAEQYWKEAKAAAAKSYDKNTDPDFFWGTTTKIFKRKANKHLGLSLEEMDEIMEGFINLKKLKKKVKVGAKKVGHKILKGLSQHPDDWDELNKRGLV